MARGRHQNWVCKNCKAEFSVQGSKPKMCCSCGSEDIGRAPSYELLMAYQEKDAETDAVVEELNAAYDRFIELKDSFDTVMSYWKKQYQRGYISKEEYQERQRKFKGTKCP